MSFWPTISIRISTDRVIFTEGDRTCSLLPRIYLDSDSPTAIILGVGDPPASGPSVRVDLFQEPLRALDYSDLLAAFFRHGFFLVLRRTFFGFFRPRPRVCFVVADSLRGYLRHYHRGALFSAALEAGALAQHVTFKNDSNATLID